MSENESNEGYVVEGNLAQVTRGWLLIYSVTGGRMPYTALAANARELELGQTYVPPIRSLKNSFAIAKNSLNGLRLPSLETAENWDGVVDREVNVVSLKKGNEYVVRIKMTGRSRGRSHVETHNLFRLEFDPPQDFNAHAWKTQYIDSQWTSGDDAVAEPDMTLLDQCLSVSPYWDDTEYDANLFANIYGQLLREFREVAISVDQNMLRDKIIKVLRDELGGLPFRSGQGAFFLPRTGDGSDQLETLENYSNLLETFGTTNALVGNPTQNNWLGENGRPRDWHRPRTNLRIMGYIDNDRQLNYIRQDIETNLSREIAEYQHQLLQVADGFNEDKVEDFEKKLDAIQTKREDLSNRLKNLTSMLGGEVNINTTPYADISEGLQTRAEGIRAVRSSIANRLANLSTIE